MNSFQITKMNDDIAGVLAGIEKLTGTKITVKTVTVVETETEHMDIVLRELLSGLVVCNETPADPAPAAPSVAMVATTQKRDAWHQNTTEKVCEICGKPFKPLRLSAKFCGEECRAEHNRRYKKALKEKKAGPNPSIDPLAIDPPAPNPV